MLETFSLRLAAGLALSLLVLPARQVSPRFSRTHLLIVLCLIVTAGIFAWNSASEATALWAALGAAAGAAVVAFWLTSAENAGLGTFAIVLTTGALLVALVHWPGTRTSSSRWPGVLADDLSAAGLLGAATTAMLMGHWYLIAPTMSLAPLLRLLAALAAANLLRLLVAAVALWQTLDNGITLDRLAWLWLSVRWIAGLLMPLGLVWMAWQSARIRSTQSATGILYVVVIFVFFGELTDQILQDHLAELGGGQT
jgi:hypothetical protein